MRDGQRADGSRQWAMGNMQWSIQKRQRAMIAAGIGATRANENYKNGSLKWRLGVKKVIFLFEDGRSRFSEMCFPPKAGSTFLQNSATKNDVMQRCMQNAFCNLHFRCKLASRSGGHKFFAFRSASAERNENHKNQVDGRFGAAERNARRCWGEI